MSNEQIYKNEYIYIYHNVGYIQNVMSIDEIDFFLSYTVLMKNE